MTTPLLEAERERAGRLVSEAIAEHKKIVEADQSMLSYAIAAGLKLLAAKEIIGHGRWGEWINENRGEMSGRTVRLHC
jgi:hypothetical protein